MAPTLSSPLLQVLTFAAFIATAGATDAAGTAFLEQKAQEPGVVATGSGLLYKIIKSSASPAKSPLVSTPTVCHYKGTLIDGTEFDSSFKRGSPATFAPNQVIKGWTEAMQLMKEEGTHCGESIKYSQNIDRRVEWYFLFFFFSVHFLFVRINHS